MDDVVPEHIFKAYDIRGIYPDELNEDLAYQVAQAYAKLFGPKVVVLGRDVRLSGPSLWDAAMRGLTDHGVTVIDIGVVTTDMMYFAVNFYGFDGGIMVSASHNPKEYNGMKLLRKGGIAVSGETGIQDIKKIVVDGYSFKTDARGTVRKQEVREDYLRKCLSLIDTSATRPLTVVVNAMFGPVLSNVSRAGLPVNLVALNGVPDGSFPKGPPDPLLPENRSETIAKIREVKPDLGAAWDGDADRFFLFDETGRFISGYFLTAFLGEHFARKNPGAKVIHDVRLTWAVRDAVSRAGGIPLVHRVGHAFIKARMREEDAVFAGEISGHFYFRDFYYADNGFIPFLLVLEILSRSGKKLSELFEPYFSNYFISDELNTKLPSQEKVQAIFERIEKKYPDLPALRTDGISLEAADWRISVRSSNTEPLVRLNVEARSAELRDRKIEEFLGLIRES